MLAADAFNVDFDPQACDSIWAGTHRLGPSGLCDTRVYILTTCVDIMFYEYVS